MQSGIREKGESGLVHKSDPLLLLFLLSSSSSSSFSSGGGQSSISIFTPPPFLPNPAHFLAPASEG